MTTILATIPLDTVTSNLPAGLLVFPLSSFLAPSGGTGPEEGFYEGEIEFTLANGEVMSVFELIDMEVRDDFGS